MGDIMRTEPPDWSDAGLTMPSEPVHRNLGHDAMVVDPASADDRISEQGKSNAMEVEPATTPGMPGAELMDDSIKIEPKDANGRPLTELKLSEPMKKFPSAVLALAKLTKLDLSGTGLSGLPSAIQSLTKLKVASFSKCNLETFPEPLLTLTSLTQLDLSGTGLSSLPSGIKSLVNLKIAFFSNCDFAVFPEELAECPKLEMVAFRSNGMTAIPENAFPQRLRWLILTGNKLESLPRSIGKCERLQKCMLSGNRLAALPEEMENCKKLGLLRLSANMLTSLPEWLFRMPELAFLSFAGNPISASDNEGKSIEASDLESIAWDNLSVSSLLGEGASGVISKGLWTSEDGQQYQVAIKLYKGAVTSDGTPLDEMQACIRAGKHENLIDPLGKIHGHPETDKHGLVMQLVSSQYFTLGLPPNFDTCTRDVFSPKTSLSHPQSLKILRGIASAAAHLHSRAISHGDLYAHNILRDEGGHALLGDFGAASFYAGTEAAMERLEVLAFAYLIQDVRGLMESASNDGELEASAKVADLQHRCSTSDVGARPTFNEIEAELQQIEQIKAR